MNDRLNISETFLKGPYNPIKKNNKKQKKQKKNINTKHVRVFFFPYLTPPCKENGYDVN